jgi:hypothetical protein
MIEDRFEAGKATYDLDRSTSNHDAVAGPVWTAMQATIDAMTSQSAGEQVLCLLLRGMKETHGSMRSVYKGAADIEKSEDQSGRWTDMLILARGQFDAVFNGLLIADDEAKWATAYKKAGWKTMAQRYFYQFRRFENTPSGQAIKATNVPRLRRLAAWVGVTNAEWSATEAHVNGTTAPSSARKIKEFPTPGGALGALKNTSLRELGRLLYPHWKFLCDAAHVGLATLLLRVLIQNVPANAAPPGARDSFIQGQILPCLGSSLAATLALVTVAALPYRLDADLCGKIVTAWVPLEKGTIEGNVIWHQWAREALGEPSPTP